MTTNDHELGPPLEFPDLLSLAQITLPPAAKKKVAAHLEQQQPNQLAVKQAVDERQEPFVIVEAGFPRIAEAIHLMWGNVELEDYLRNLIMADRAGRDGLPDAVHAALLKLYNQHASLFKFPTRAEAEDAWSRDTEATQRLKEEQAKRRKLR